MLKKIIISTIFFQIIITSNLIGQYYRDDFKQNDRRSFENFIPINLIDTPTANILTEDRGIDQKSIKYFHLSLRVYKQGGMIGGISVGLTRHMMFGVSYGGEKVIGEGEVVWNPSPGIHFRYKIFSETNNLPTFALGFNSQGYGSYDEEKARYDKKSPGLFVVASKNYATALLRSGLHGGISYSTENKSSDKDMNLFVGAHFILEDELSVLWEYDFGTNDNDELSYGSGKGYMNIAIRWLFVNQLILEFSVKNLLKNRKDENGETIPYTTRELKIIYRQPL